MEHILFQRLNSSTDRFGWALGLIIVVILANGCQQNRENEKGDRIEEVLMIPKPKKILYKRGHFKLDKTSKVLMNLSDEKSREAGKFIIEKILAKTHYKLKIADVFTTTNVQSAIEIITDSNKVLTPEGFKIIITRNRIKIMARDANGFYYATQAALSLFSQKNNTWQAPQIVIEDEPKIKTRGLYLQLNDSTLVKDDLIQLLATNRINYLIIPGDFLKGNNGYVQINNDEGIKKIGHFNRAVSIKDFYQNSTSLGDTLIYTISNQNQIHPDSIAVLGQSLWSTTTKDNYHALLNQLDERSKQ